jgi:hypothetical protein
MASKVCVECGHAVVDIYKEFSKGSVRLTRCDHCHKIAVCCLLVKLCLRRPQSLDTDDCQFIHVANGSQDKYVEYEMMLIIIDLILHKPQVYRHILFNRIPFRPRGFDVRSQLCMSDCVCVCVCV